MYKHTGHCICNVLALLLTLGLTPKNSNPNHNHNFNFSSKCGNFPERHVVRQKIHSLEGYVALMLVNSTEW